MSQSVGRLADGELVDSVRIIIDKGLGKNQSGVLDPMLIYQKHLVVAALGWAASVGAASATTRSQNHVTEQVKELKSSTEAKSGEAYLPYPDKYDERCYYAPNHDSADLCAQWRAVVATERAASAANSGNYIGSAGAVLSFISIVLVLIALGQTRNANRLSKKQFETARDDAIESAVYMATALAQGQRSADAASSQSKIAAQMFAADFRPWISVTALNLNIDPGFQPHTQIAFQNIGKTIAHSCFVYENTEVANFTAPLLGSVSQVGGASVHLMPNESVNLPVRPSKPFSGEELRQIEKGMPLRMWTHGRVEYVDELGKSHTTYFAFCYSGGAMHGKDLPRYERTIELPKPT